MVPTPLDRSVNTPSYRMGESNLHMSNLLATGPALGQCGMLQNQLIVLVLISAQNRSLLKAASPDLSITGSSDTDVFSWFYLTVTQSQRFY